MSSKVKLATSVSDLVVSKIKYQHSFDSNNPFSLAVAELVKCIENELETLFKNEGMETRHWEHVKSHIDKQVDSIITISEKTNIVNYLEEDFIQLSIQQIKSNGKLAESVKLRHQLLLKAITVYYMQNDGMESQQIEDMLAVKVTVSLTKEINLLFGKES